MHAMKLACNPTPWEAEPEGLLLVQGHFMVPGQVRLHSEWNNGRLLSERTGAGPERSRPAECTAENSLAPFPADTAPSSWSWSWCVLTL